MTKHLEPTPPLIRKEIEEVKNPEARMYYKCLLTVGGRSAEFAGENCTNEKAYGTIGEGHAWIEDYQPKTISPEEQTERLNQLSQNPNVSITQVLTAMMMPPKPVKALILKVPIAKKTFTRRRIRPIPAQRNSSRQKI